MDRRDYILRMIERFGQFAIALRDMILGRADADQIREQLRTAAGYAGLDLELARVVALDTLVGMAAPGGIGGGMHNRSRRARTFVQLKTGPPLHDPASADR